MRAGEISQTLVTNAASLKVNRLFHYQKFNIEWLRLAVINQKIYLSDPATFNDPWDCRPFFYIPTENESPLRENYIQWFDTRSRTHNHEISEAEHIRNAANLRRDQTYFESVVKQFSASMGDAISYQYRVYCLSTQSDSALMWSHYANNHQGVCLEFRCDNEVFGSAMKINYADEYPRLDFTNDELLPLVTKSSVWCYEDEYRVVALEKFVGPPFAGVLRTRKNFLRMPRRALRSVIMGCMITKSDYVQLQEIIEKQFPQYIALKRAVRVPNRYSLSIEMC